MKNVHPCTLLNDKFFYRKTYCCLEPPPSVAVCGETEPAKCVVRWNAKRKTTHFMYTYCVTTYRAGTYIVRSAEVVKIIYYNPRNAEGG